MEIWSSPKTNGVYGLFIPESWNELVTYLLDNGILKRPVPANRIFTNEFIKEANYFDRAAVEHQAKTFDVKSMR
jgi:hypothetical protein